MVERIAPHEAAQRMNEEGYLYVDVRSAPEFDQGHPRGAYNVPLLHMGAGGMEPNPDFLEVMKRHFSEDQKIVVGCKAGGRSARAARLLTDEGYTHVLDQRAGYGGARGPFGEVTEPGWQSAGLPVSEAAPGRRWVDLEGG